jgi:hypothetical protein
MSIEDNNTNENLLSDLFIGYLENDTFKISMINTRLVNRFNEGLLELDDLTFVYRHFLFEGGVNE